MNKAQMVTFRADGVHDVMVLLGEGAVLVPSGYGGWSVIDRARRKGLTQWDGIDPMRMQIPILFDGYLDGTSQEIPISRLSRMALPAEDGEPPVVTVEGAGIPKPGPTEWVIESLVPGTNVMLGFATNGVMARLRQDYTVNLLEFVDEDRVAFKNLPPGAGAVTGGAGWPKQYIVKDGDTLPKIANKFYGDSTKWPKIAKANGIRDPKAIKPGLKLTIPNPKD